MKLFSKISIPLVVFGILLIGLSLWKFIGIQAIKIGTWLVVRDPLEKADLIHVVSGPDYRAEYGIQLLQLGYADHIFFTGGWCSCTQDISAERYQRIALLDGVPESEISIDSTQITSTYAEAERLKLFIQDHSPKIQKVIIVSTPFHMRRVMWTYRKVLGDQVQLIMAPVPYEQAGMSPQWWTNSESRSMVLEEYAKLYYYLFRYQLTSGKLQAWLASFDTE